MTEAMETKTRIVRPRRFSLPWLAAGIALGGLLLAGGVFFILQPQKGALPLWLGTGLGSSPMETGSPLATVLYFATPEGDLAQETRLITHRGLDTVKQAKEVLAELIKGPRGETLLPVLPGGTKVRSLHLTPEGECYLDLSREVREGLPGGVLTETLAVEAVVRTLTANFPEIRQVQILVGGMEAETLSGHVDLSQPFASPSTKGAAPLETR